MINELRDPQEVLPTELFTQLISILQNQSIIRLSGVSKQWRRIINDTPSLHQEIDLSSLIYTSQMVRALQHLSSLSLHRLTKVTLHLNKIEVGDDFVRKLGGSNFDDERKWGISMVSLPFSILERSSQTLRSITFDEASSLSDPLLLAILLRLPTLVNLKRFEASTDSPFTFKAGNGSSSNQLEIIIRGHYDDVKEEDLVMAGPIMRLVRRISGSGFTLFECSNTFDKFTPPSEETVAGFLEELSHSKTTMKEFTWSTDFSTDDLSYGLVPRWNFWLQCPHLESLKFLVNAESLSPMQSETTLPIPAGLSPMKLKSLHLVISGGRVQWQNLSKWIGEELEFFTLTTQAFHLDTTIWYFSPLLFLSHFNETLKDIDLHLDYDGKVENFPLPPPSEVSFPQLEFLGLETCNSAIYEFFSKVESPRLSTLYFFPSGISAHESPPMENLGQDEVECLMSLLRNNRFSLETVMLVIYLGNERQSYLSQELLVFPKLRCLSLKGLGSAFGEAFSKFQYPSLKYLDLPERYQPLFKDLPSECEITELGELGAY